MIKCLFCYRFHRLICRYIKSFHDSRLQKYRNLSKRSFFNSVCLIFSTNKSLAKWNTKLLKSRIDFRREKTILPKPFYLDQKSMRDQRLIDRSVYALIFSEKNQKKSIKHEYIIIWINYTKEIKLSNSSVGIWNKSAYFRQEINSSM